jgi:hypothetical protein
MCERMIQEEVNRFTTKLSTSLGMKLEVNYISLDIQNFQIRLREFIKEVLLNPKIPENAKEKFKQDLSKKMDLLADLNVSDIKSLQNRRAVESIGMEAWELRDKSDEQKQKYFLEKILDETIELYVEPTVYALKQTFAGEKVSPKTLQEVSYNKENYMKFTSEVPALDSFLHLDILGRSIKPLYEKMDISQMNIHYDI